MGLEAVYLKSVTDQLVPYYRNADKAHQVIMEHCGISGACGLIPATGIDMAVMASSNIVMFGRLNKTLGLSLSRDTSRVLGKFACSLVAGNLASIPIALLAGVGGSLLKLVPGVGTALGAVLTCGAYASCTYVTGIVYLKALAKTTQGGPVTEEALKAALEREMKDKKQFKRLFEEGQKAIKGMKFSEFRAKAEKVREEEPGGN